MKGPIVSIDVSNGSSHYILFKKNNVKLGKVKKIEHTIEGFNQLLKDIHKLSNETDEEVCAVYESTGVYTAPLSRFLDKNGISQYAISPLESARKRKETVHSKKTDKLDPVAISKVYYDKEKMREYKIEKDVYQELRLLNRLYEDRLEHLRKNKVTFQNMLSVVFPGYMGLFDGGYSDISLVVLKKYPHPDMIKNKKVETIARYIEKNTSHRHGMAMKTAEKIIRHANETYPGCDKDDLEVSILIEMIDKVTDSIRECKEILNRLISKASTTREYKYIITIDGIGANLAARIIAEIGEICRFMSREALIAYAGLDPNISQSGDISGEHLKISKKGNKRLRCLLYLAVTCSLKQKKENPINSFYAKKRQQSNPLNSKAAKIACAAKLLKIIYGMCRTETTYHR